MKTVLVVMAICIFSLAAILYQPWTSGERLPASRTADPDKHSAPAAGSTAANTAEDQAAKGPADSVSPISNELVQAKWEPAAANAVVALNRDWFSILAEENVAGLAKQIAMLKDLGGQRRVMRFLVEHPETAGLLAGVRDPDVVIDTLEQTGENYDLLTSLYAIHAAPDDATQLAEALQASECQICRLYERRMLGTEVMFIFDRNGESDQEYDRWLREAVDLALTQSDETMASMTSLLLQHGPDIRKRLTRSDDFRLRFRAEIWPSMLEVAGNSAGMFENYMDDSRVWDLLCLPQGKHLLQRCGPLPVDLLYGYPEMGRRAYPEDLQEAIIQALLIGDENTISALMNFRSEPLFHDLLRRPLPPAVLGAAIDRLLRAGPNYHSLLISYHRLADGALAEEVGPPPKGWRTWIPFYYTVYEVPKKIIQGRDPTFMDWVQAVADPVSLVLPVAKGTQIGTKTTKSVGGKVISQSLKRQALEVAERQLGTEVAAKVSEEGLMKFAATAALRDLPATLREALNKVATVDITDLVRFTFNYSRVGRETYKILTGLEARVFMRGDAKVAIRLGNLAAGVLSSRFMRETADSFALGAAAESNIGLDAGRQVGRALQITKAQLDSWRKNLSAWWLMNASGMTNLAAVTVPSEAPR